MYCLADIFRAWKEAKAMVGKSRYGHDNRAWQRRADALGVELCHEMARP